MENLEIQWDDFTGKLVNPCYDIDPNDHSVFIEHEGSPCLSVMMGHLYPIPKRVTIPWLLKYYKEEINKVANWMIKQAIDAGCGIVIIWRSVGKDIEIGGYLYDSVKKSKAPDWFVPNDWLKDWINE